MRGGARLAKQGCAVILLLLPAWINSGPLIFADTRAYYRGGRAVIAKLTSIAGTVFSTVAPSGDLDNTLTSARGVRSAFYSLFVNVLAQVGSLWLIIAVQAVVTVWCILLLMRTYQFDQTRFLVMMTFMALFTTLPWTVSVVMPDIFTPLMGLILICLLSSWMQISNAKRYMLLSLFAACIVMHITNLPIAVLLILLSMIVYWRSFRLMLPRWTAAGAMVAVAVLAMLVVGVVGFGEWTITPQSPPFLLARSIGDGPGKLYLREHCPEAGLAMCRHLDRLDVSDDDFMWHANGVYSAVPADERAELRRENKVFLLAAKEHPLMEAKAMLLHGVEQLIDFSLLDAALHSRATIGGDDLIQYPLEPWEGVRWGFTVVNYVFMLVSLGALVWAWRFGHLNVHTKRLVIMVVGLVVINAALTGSLSTPAPRYCARTSWLLPLLAVMLVYGTKPWTLKPR